MLYRRMLISLCVTIAFIIVPCQRTVVFSSVANPDIPDDIRLEREADVLGQPTSLKGERKRAELWFPVGERLIYGIRWGPFKVGIAEISSEWIEENERELIAIRVSIKATPFFYRIYRVEGLIESIVDPEPFTPLRFTQRTRAGRHRAHEEIVFDHEAQIAIWTDFLADKNEKVPVEPETRCAASLMYYLRSYKFEPDSVYNFQVMADKKIYDLEIISGDYQTIKLRNFGDVNSLLMQTSVSFRGLPARIDELRVWLSDDGRSLCARALAGTVLGTVVMTLDSVKGPGEDFWSGGSGDIKK